MNLIKIKGIQSVETMLLVSPRKYNLFTWQAPTARNKRKLFATFANAAANYGNYTLQEIEQRILNALIEEGPTRPKRLALKLDIGERVVRKHLKAMWQNEVYKIEVVPIANVLEYETQAIVGITINRPLTHRIIDSI